MKKKPPPGATLIARLKEQRLAREAELARRQAGEAGGEAAAPEAPQVQVPEVLQAQAPEAPPLAEPVPEPVPEALPTVDVTVVEEAEPRPARKASEPAQQEIIVHHAGNGSPAAGDLLHRQIDIGDLRPTTDDYFVLTDEIRLAGRFAAVGLIAQGLRLARLRHDEIYKNHYATFEEYCRKEHQMSATYAYRLIRMSEMAERMAELGGPGVNAHSDAMPDPFEVMLGLGHRHLMALLPLEPEAAQELLIRGIPVVEGDEPSDQRVPITRATERQIREALKQFVSEPSTAKTKVIPKKALATEKQLIPALNKLVEMLEDWALWLGGETPEELEAARMGRGQLLNRLAKRFRTASGKIADALEGEDDK